MNRKRPRKRAPAAKAGAAGGVKARDKNKGGGPPVGDRAAHPITVRRQRELPFSTFVSISRRSSPTRWSSWRRLWGATTNASHVGGRVVVVQGQLRRNESSDC